MKSSYGGKSVCTVVKTRDLRYGFYVKGKEVATIDKIGRTHSAHKSRKMHSTKGQREVTIIICKLSMMNVGTIVGKYVADNEVQYLNSLLMTANGN